MRRHFLYLALVGLAVLTVGASSTFAARNSAISYVFNGRLLASTSAGRTVCRRSCRSRTS